MALGSLVAPAVDASDALLRESASTSLRATSLLRSGGADVYSLRFVAPFDEEAFLEAASPYARIIVLEEGVARGGFGESLVSLVATRLPRVAASAAGFPPEPYPQASREELLAKAGLDAAGHRRARARSRGRRSRQADLRVQRLEGGRMTRSDFPSSRPFLLRMDSGPLVMGIVNVTPDSFYPGSRRAGAAEAAEAALAMEADGAAIVDLGGESTRPGSDYVGEAEELERMVPTVAAIRARSDVPVSVDTRKAAVARAAIEAGADMINDVSALGHDPGMASVAAEKGVPVVLMHMKGEPKTMQEAPVYADCVAEVRDFLFGAAARAIASGIDRGRIILDPGIGFGKRLEDNLGLLRPARRAGRARLPLGRGPLAQGLPRRSHRQGRGRTARRQPGRGLRGHARRRRHLPGPRRRGDRRRADGLRGGRSAGRPAVPAEARDVPMRGPVADAALNAAIGQIFSNYVRPRSTSSSSRISSTRLTRSW